MLVLKQSVKNTNSKNSGLICKKEQNMPHFFQKLDNLSRNLHVWGINM